MDSKDPKKSKQCNACKRKHVTLTIPQKLDIIRDLKVAKSKETLSLYTTLDHQLSTI
jgi:hypothetical protein